MLNSNKYNQPTPQKKVLALHDLSCAGRSSLVPITATISAMGHQCVPVPTAVFSTHTAIPNWVCTDLTPALDPTLAHFESLGMRFEAIYSGFLSTAAQIDSVAAAAKLKADGGLFVVDPVMGDNGKIYKTYTPEMISRMGELCVLADLITPNVTEAALLLGYSPDTQPADRDDAAAWCSALSARFDAAVILTGLTFVPDRIAIACCTENGTDFVQHARIPQYYPGTGDLFVSVLLGNLLRGSELTESAARAGSFVRDVISYTAAQGTDPMLGVQFEPLLCELTNQEK